MTYIYALVDPRTAEVRYVGKSNDPDRRIRHHLKPSTDANLPLARWAKKLRGLALRPGVLVLEETSSGAWQVAERWWIATMRAIRGNRLLNITEGGEGGPITRGKVLSLEHRAKIANAIRGIKRSPETRARISAARLGKAQTPEHRMAISLAQTGRKRPAQGEAMRQHYAKPEARQRTGEASRNAWQNEERKRRMSERMHLYWSDPGKRVAHGEKIRRRAQEKGR